MGKGQVTGQAYLQSVLSKITDPELRASAEKVFANAVVQTEIGNGVEGQSEIDRQLQELKTKTDALATTETELADLQTRLTGWQGELTGWRDTNAEYIKLGRAVKEGKPVVGADGKPVVAAALPAGVVTEEKLGEVLKNEMGGVLTFAVDQNSLQLEHFNKFGKILDIGPLIAHPKIREVGLKGVYELVHKEALAAHATEAATAAENKIRADERSKVNAEHASMPYPPPTGSASGSPLDALTVKGNTPLVDAATAEYHRLVAARP